MFNFDRIDSESVFMDELERFIEFWLGPRQAAFGVSEGELLGLELPEALARFYEFAGRWPTISTEREYAKNAFSIQDSLYEIWELKAESDGKIAFISENQGCWVCATEKKTANPRVWVAGEGLGRRYDEWVLLRDPLYRVLGSFVMQELVFGSRVLSTNTVLLEAIEPAIAKTVPIWSNAEFVYPWDQRSFYLLDEGILVARMGGALWAAANSNSGIAAIERGLGDISFLMVSVPSGWSMEIRTDGSGKLCLSGASNTTGRFPAGTFDFDEGRDLLQKMSDDERGSNPGFLVFLSRDGDNCTRGRGLRHPKIAASLITKAMKAVNEKEANYDTAIRSLALPE